MTKAVRVDGLFVLFCLMGAEMEFVRQIVDSNTLKQVLTLPPSLHDSQVEIIVLPLDNHEAGLTAPSSSRPVNHSSYGRLKAYANPSLIPEEEGAWEKAVAEKYALH